ncbi:ATP-dependent helicase [Pseudactinotalea sp. HY160]|uniref:DEAD/DEAH box helicase n=1 Tax=Pseudactinotalea sp. HY160 TaxID=2654490 RepID=UPI001310D8E4|nr:ATP-dependent helicase [Pseudactinotalea sp. HY160]
MPNHGSSAAPRTSPRAGEVAPIIPILARKVREVEAKSNRGKVGPTNRTRFQVIALLVRDERSRIRDDSALSGNTRSELLKRLDGIATILARIAARDTSLLSLLDSQTQPGPSAQRMRNEWLLSSGAELSEEELQIKAPAPARTPVVSASLAQKQVVPAGVPKRLKARPFAPPVFPSGTSPAVGHLSGWDLLEPLYRSFEQGAGGGAASMPLPPSPRIDQYSPKPLELMAHQLQLLESVKQGHRSFLLADEPGLGKTAQSVIAASVAHAYPLLAVVPNVVKINWAREVSLWTPRRKVSVIHGDGRDVDAFADVFVINYEILDRHLGWLSRFGFRGMVVDEAHFIKNLSSQRSQHVLALADQIRRSAPDGDPLLMALTGTPLINDIEDFHAIWRFLGWVDAEGPTPRLRQALEAIGRTPADRAFYPEARTAVVDQGIVRRVKTEVAKDLPARRVVDLPVELDDDLGRSIRQAERELGARLAAKYRALTASRSSREGWDLDIMRHVAEGELEASRSASSGENVFTMVRRIGQAKASLASDYTAQLAHSVGKVVLFAKHIDVMDTAERLLAEAGLRTVSIRGEQSSSTRQRAIDAFTTDPGVSVAICSLTAAGVGLNLHVASNVVLAELSWTAAEQAQAIDRVHRIGQEEPVTAWRILAAHTVDTKIAELIDAKKGLAARALDGSDEEIVSTTTVQVDALVHLLMEALEG